MKSMYISSGSISKLLSAKGTEGHKQLLKDFVSDEVPFYNAKRSPIDQFRIGAILEERFFLTLDDSYLPQYRVVCEKMNVCRATLDFAKIESNKVTDFKETKTCFFTDFLAFQPYKNAPYDEYIEFIKKNYKSNYNQVQFQMMCAGLDECSLVYIEVKNYNYFENETRIIHLDEYLDFRIKRDEKIISEIEERASIFQKIKDYYE